MEIKSTCLVPGCGNSGQPCKYLCKSHWSMVHPAIRQLVIEAHNDGHVRGLETPTAEWVVAVFCAVNCCHEGMPLQGKMQLGELCKALCYQMREFGYGSKEPWYREGRLKERGVGSE